MMTKVKSIISERYILKVKNIYFLNINYTIMSNVFVNVSLLENNHQCVPFGLFITNINLLLLLFFFNY